MLYILFKDDFAKLTSDLNMHVRLHADLNGWIWTRSHSMNFQEVPDVVVQIWPRTLCCLRSFLMNFCEVPQGPETTPVGIHIFTTCYSALYNTDTSWYWPWPCVERNYWKLRVSDTPTNGCKWKNFFSNQKWQNIAANLYYNHFANKLPDN